MRQLHRTTLALLALSAVLSSDPLDAQARTRSQPWPAEIVELAEALPVQDGGRIKPLHTYAGFTMLRLNGKRSLETDQEERLTPVEWLLDVFFYPEQAARYESFIVSNSEVIEAIGVPTTGKKKRDHYSFEELRSGVPKLFQLAREYGAIEDKDRTSLQQQVFVLASNVNSYMMLTGHFDYARTPIRIGSDERLRAIFDGREEVGFHDVVNHLGELRELYTQMSEELGTTQAPEMQVIADVISSSADLTSGTEFFVFLPPVGSAEESEEWHTPADLFASAFDHGHVSPEYAELLAGLEDLAQSTDDLGAFQSRLEGLQGTLVGMAEARGEYTKVPRELAYYKAKLLSKSLVLFVLSFLLMAFMWLRPRSRVLHWATSLCVLVATLLVTWAIVQRCIIRGRPPVSTLYETVLFVTGTGALTALIVEAINKQKLAISAAAILGTVGLLIANGYEMLDKSDTMPSLVAVLDTNFWLATHVTAITLGYSAGMLAALFASVYLLLKFVGIRRGDKPFFKSLSRMTYGALAFAVIFSTVGTILGGIWANYSWGRFWGWDPKENGALLIVIAQLVILHLRNGGYVRDHGVAMATALQGTVIGFSWWGVNLLGVGLHSYGFTSGIATALWSYYYIQWGIVGLGGVAWMMERAREQAKLELAEQQKA